MAYEEKKEYEEGGYFSAVKVFRYLLQKWWLILLMMVGFAVIGFGFAKLTYKEAYSSRIIFNVNNKDKNIVGAASQYMTASDVEASVKIANNFKYLINNGNDFITEVQSVVKTKTGQDYSAAYLRSCISTEVIADSTMLSITVKTRSAELTDAIATAIQSVSIPITEKAFPTATFTVSDSATTAALQKDSSTTLYTVVGLLIGIFLGVILVLFYSRLRNMVLSVDDIKKAYNMGILASVVKIKLKKNDTKKLLIIDKNVGLPFIETFKLIRTKIENVKLKKGFSVFAVTSSTEGEGKTTCSVNIALSLAKSGKSVLLIDADLRKPAVYRTLGIPVGEDQGIFDIVSGKKTFEEAVKYVEKYNLYILISGVEINDPSEVLASHEMGNIVKEAKKNFDYVIVDCPPAGVVADAAIVANYTDTIIFVAAEDAVTVPQVESALSDLLTTKADILGCIYNCANGRFISLSEKSSGGYFSSGYGHYYGSYGNYGGYGYSSHRKK